MYTDFVLISRGKSVIDKIDWALIHENQRGFMKGRYIGENTRIVYDIIQISNKHKIPGMILLVDFERAFDSVSWSFMYKALYFFQLWSRYYQMGENFISDANLCIIKNGIFSEFFNIGSGCRKGDTVLPYLFNICVVIMGILIRQNKISKEYTL